MEHIGKAAEEKKLSFELYCTDEDVVFEKLGDSSKEWLMVVVMLETNLTGGSNQSNLSLNFNLFVFSVVRRLTNAVEGDQTM